MMKIALLGDIALFSTGMLKAGWEKRIQGVADYLAGFDAVIANLEVPITDQAATMVCKGIHLQTNAEILDVLKYLHVTAVCLANNHIYDYGKKGMKDTLNALENARIPYYGVHNKSFVFTKGDESVSFSGFSCYSTNGAHYTESSTKEGVRALTRDAVFASLEEDHRNNRFSVMSLHWGDEYSNLPNERQVKLFYEMSKKNNHVLHGHHAHVVQGLETCEGSLAAYNMGNFCFDDSRSRVNPKLAIKQSQETRESFILEVEIKGRQIARWNTTGIYHMDDTIIFRDNSKKIQELSKMISQCKTETYKETSRQMIARQKASNLAKKDFRWLMSKMNYYAIGAKLISYVNDYHYRKAY